MRERYDEQAKKFAKDLDGPECRWPEENGSGIDSASDDRDADGAGAYFDDDSGDYGDYEGDAQDEQRTNEVEIEEEEVEDDDDSDDSDSEEDDGDENSGADGDVQSSDGQDHVQDYDVLERMGDA